MRNRVKHSVAGYADTPQQKNFPFEFKVSSITEAKNFIARAEKKHWIIRAAYHNTRQNGIKINSIRIK